MTVSYQQRRKSRRIVRILAGLITMIGILVIFGILVVVRPLPSLVDSSVVSRSGYTQQVSQTDLSMYCPARMGLADDTQFGDSAYQVTQGDIASAARYGAFGSIYGASVQSLQSDAGDDDALSLGNASIVDSANVKVASGDVDSAPRILQAKLLASQLGTGIAASTVSWATQGDLQGLSAATCVQPQLEQDFLLDDTNTGTTHQLIVSNPSSQAASLDISIWGSEQSDQMSLSTGSTMNVAAHGQASMELSAAASGQKGLLVKVSSADTPVFAIVRSVRMDGLTPQGSDFNEPLNTAQADSVFPAVHQTDDVAVLAYSDKNTSLKCSWLGSDEQELSKTIDVRMNTVSITDLGKPPKGAVALRVVSRHPVQVQVKTLSKTDDHEDFAFISAAQRAKSSAIVLPDHMQGELTVVNPTSQERSGVLHAFDFEGNHIANVKMTLASGSAKQYTSDDLPDKAALFLLDGDGSLAWSMRLSNEDLDSAHVAQIAYLGSRTLSAQKQLVRAFEDSRIVH